MADAKILLYAKCSSCRKADALLAGSGLDVERRDMFKRQLGPDEIRRLLMEIGKSPHDLLSRRSIPFRQLGLASRAVSENELIDLMAEHPALIRRPIIVAGEEALIGFSQSAIERVVARMGAK